MSVRIIVDSASDLTKERADALNLDYMPLKTIFGETEYLDGVTISHKEFYEKLIECGTIPTTSQVSPHDFEAKFKEVKEAGDTAVVICLSSLLSGTYQSAHIALDGYEDCITLVDSLNVCLGEQILVLYAVKLRDEGLSAKEIAEKLEEKKKDVCVLAVFDTLEYLKQGGRISKTAAWAGNILSIKPVIAIEKGEVAILGKCSRSKFLSKLLKTFDKTFREIFPVFISTKRREKPSAFFDNNFVNNAYFSEAASSSSSHLASSSSKAPISSRMTCLCLWSS